MSKSEPSCPFRLGYIHNVPRPQNITEVEITPSEITPVTGTFNCSSSSLTSVSKAVKSPCVLLSKGRASRISSDRQSRTTQSTSCPTSGRPPVDGQNHTLLLLQPRLDALVICYAQRHQFFIALHQIGDTALRDAHPTAQQRSVHLRHAAVRAYAPAANQGNHPARPNSPWGSAQRPSSSGR